MNKRILGFLLISCLMASLVGVLLPASCGNNRALATSTIYVPDNYSTIQAAVNAASAGDTIIVRDGTYTENVDVNKSLTIQSENGATSTIVQAANPNDSVFEVTADYVTIKAFTVKGAKGIGWTAGINLNGDHSDYVEYCNISSNISSDNSFGIYLYHSSHSIVTNNTLSKNRTGILFYFSSNHTLTNNTMSNNNQNFGVWGTRLSDYTHNIDVSNMVNGKPIYYWVNMQSQQVPSDAGYVGIVNCTNITVKNLTLSMNQEGILLAYSSNSRIENVNVSDNRWGIRLQNSFNNTLINNTVWNNSGEGVSIRDSSNNTLTSNAIWSNSYNFFITGEELSHFNNNIDTSNTVEGAPIQYLVDQDGLIIDPSWDIGYLGIVNCTNITVKDLTLANNGQGVLLAYSSNSRIESVNVLDSIHGVELNHSSNNTVINSTFSNCEPGVYLRYASNNTVAHSNFSAGWDGINGSYSSGNKLLNNILKNCRRWAIRLTQSPGNTLVRNTISNSRVGIYLAESTDNEIYLNTIMNNTDNISSLNSTNIWNSPEKITYTYNGSSYANYLGNYWYDYSGSDVNNDGIGDIPYSINLDDDNYPLMQPTENYSLLNWFPSQPSSVLPTDGATGISLTPTLQSSAFSDPDAGDTHQASQWQIRASGGSYDSPVFNSGTDTSNLTQITIPSGKLTYSTTYYWQVRHQDNKGAWSEWAAETSFATAPPKYSLSINIQPSGSGTVTLNPSQPTEGYSSGIVVTLTANPSSGYQFDHWSGDASGTSPSVSITMDSNKTVAAHFSPVPPGEEPEEGKEPMGCACPASEVKTSPRELAFGWGIFGFLWGAGYYLLRRNNQAKKK